MKRVALYARVSTADQNAAMQLGELREFAERRGFTVYREYVDIITGNVTGRKKPAAYTDLMADAKRRRFDIVAVWKFDRLARSLTALLGALETFSSLGIDFISATQDVDTTTPMGKLFFQVVGAFAEFERSLIVERVRAGLDYARRAGKKLGRPRDPMGKDIVALRATGLSFRKIREVTGRSLSGIQNICKRGGIEK